MAHLTTTRHLTSDELAMAMTPRRSPLLLEERIVERRASGEQAVFGCAEGPFSSYERVLETIDPDAAGLVTVTEHVSYRLAVPYFGRAFEILMRRHLRAGQRRGDPWWAPPARLDQRAATVLGAGCALAVAVGFIGGLITHTMTFIAADLGATLPEQTHALSLTRIGALATLAIGVVADRVGRRPLIAVAVLGAATAALATAAATSLLWVGVAQTLSRGLVAGGGVLVAITVIEEMPAAARAYAIGLLAMAGGLGVGMVLWVLPIADIGPGSWRVIYCLAVLFGALAADAVRRLPESRRFHRLDRTRSAAPGGISGRRLAILAVVFVLLNLFIGPAQQLQNEYLRTVRGFGGSGITAFLLLTNTWGFIGIVVGGRMADRHSRRLVGSVGLAALALANAAMFSGGGWPMWIWSLTGSVLGAATTPALGVLGPELFPTARRGTANGLITIAAVAGSVIGLELAGSMIERFGYATTFFTLAAGPLAVIGLLRWLPETARIELEALNDPNSSGDRSSAAPTDADAAVASDS